MPTEWRGSLTVMTLKAEHRELLRRLTLNDTKTMRRVMSQRRIGTQRLLDDRTSALVLLAGLFALNAEITTLQVARDELLETGAADEEIVATYFAVLPIVGTARIDTALSRLTIALANE